MNKNVLLNVILVLLSVFIGIVVFGIYTYKVLESHVDYDYSTRVSYIPYYSNIKLKNNNV